MTLPLTRPLSTENAILRAIGAPQISLPLSAGLSATFQTPGMGGLAATEFEIAGAKQFRTEDEFIAAFEAEREREREARALAREMSFAVTDRERDQIGARLQEIQTERQAALDSATQQAIADGRLQTPEALNEQYKDFGLTFDRPATAEEARLLAENKKAEIIRNAIKAQSPGGVVAGAAYFGAGLLSMATDPLEVATMFIPVVGQAGKAAAVARFGRVGGRVAVGAVEGGVGSALTEPVYYGLSRAQQLDYTMADALMNVGLGFVLGGGIGAASGVMARGGEVPKTDLPDIEMPPRERELAWREAESIRRLAAEQRPVADVALRQFATGQAVEVAPVMPRLTIRDKLAQIEKDIARTAKYPVTKVVRDIGVHPDSAFATDLRAAGITNRTMPGLFTKRGIDLDAATPAALDAVIPGVSQRLGVTDGALDRNAILATVIAEVQGTGAPSARAEMASRAEAMGDEARQLEETWTAAKEAGIVLGDEAEIRLVGALTRQGFGIEQALEIAAPRTMAARASDLAAHAETDPLADADAAALFDRIMSDTVMDEDIADMEAMVRQMEKDLSADARADLDAITATDEKATAWSDAVQAAAVCMARVL